MVAIKVPAVTNVFINGLAFIQITFLMVIITTAGRWRHDLGSDMLAYLLAMIMHSHGRKSDVKDTLSE